MKALRALGTNQRISKVTLYWTGINDVTWLLGNVVTFFILNELKSSYEWFGESITIIEPAWYKSNFSESVWGKIFLTIDIDFKW